VTTDPTQSRQKGRPYVFSRGHHIRVLHPRVGAFMRTGVEVERARPLIFWLRSKHGTMRVVAEMLRIPESTLRGYAYKQQLKHIPPRAAERIVRSVLAHKGGSVVWSTLEWS
jgi:hypothetical protein